MSYHEIIEDLRDGKIPTNINPAKRRYWPRFAFHFTDINNAVNILKDGKLISRELASNMHSMSNDNASQEVINQTEDFVEKNVRLYFRPRTATQYYNEGFQTRAVRKQLDFQADCPVPIFFLFDLESLLEQPGVQFSAQSLAVKNYGRLMSTVDDFANLPFSDIYSDGAIDGDDVHRKEVIRRRQAEILVPNKLDLSKLKVILVRSEAEKVTFLQLLHEQDINEFDSMIQIGDESTFYKDRNYIDKVSLFSKRFVLENRTKSPFPVDWGNPANVSSFTAIVPENTDYFLDVSVVIQLDDGSPAFKWPSGNDKGILKNKMSFNFRNSKVDYSLAVYIDGHISL